MSKKFIYKYLSEEELKSISAKISEIEKTTSGELVITIKEKRGWLEKTKSVRMLAEKEFDFFIGKAGYIKNPGDFIWKRILESAKASDSVLLFEKELSKQFGDDKKYAFEERNGKTIRQYSSAFTIAFNSSGSMDAIWSGPFIFLSRVKCFSIILAPNAAAAIGISIPMV